MGQGLNSLFGLGTGVYDFGKSSGWWGDNSSSAIGQFSADSGTYNGGYQWGRDGTTLSDFSDQTSGFSDEDLSGWLGQAF